MKQSFACPRSSKLSSFTLVELLVVIGIITILAAVLMSAIGSALRAAKRSQAANMMTQLQTAALAYNTEYSIYPVPPGTTTGYLIPDTAAGSDTVGTAAATAWGNLVEALCGNIKPSTGAAASQTSITNSRGILFLSLRTSDVDSSDAPLNPLPTGTGSSTEKYFNIAMDSGYSGVLGVAPSTVTTMPNFSGTFSATGGGTSTAGVAVWANCNGTTSTTNANFYVHTY